MVKEKKILKYSEESMAAALRDVCNGMSYRAAAKNHNVPRISLMRKHKNNLPAKSKMGPPTVFSQEQENLLVHWILKMANSGFPVTKETLLYSAKKLAIDLNLQFGGNIQPGNKWYTLFLARHPNISLRTSQNLTIRRGQVSEVDIASWFQEVKDYLDQNNLTNILDDPRRVFNTDETAFFLNPKPGKVLAQKGSKSIYTSAGSDEKENITVLVTANAEGKIVPPMVVYRFMRIPQNIATAMPEEWAIGRSENGWMTQELFYEFICNIFLPWVKKENIPLPIILFMDGHSSHVSLPLSTFCSENGINLVALFPNATHLLQPLDVSVFHTMKTAWRQKVQEWRMQNDGKPILKVNFPEVLKSVLPAVTPTIIQNGFKKCGLVPWDPTQITIPNKSEAAAETVKPIDYNLIKFFKQLEKEIGTEKIQTFNDSSENWVGAVEDTSLFDLWKKTKSKLEGVHTKQSNERMTLQPIEDIALQDISNQIEDSERTPIRNITPTTPDTTLPSTSSNTQENIPTPFKKNLLWPVAETGTRKRAREKIPAVVTSPSMLQYLKKKEDIKKQKEQEKEKRKQVREAKKVMSLEKKKRRRDPSTSSDSSISLDDLDKGRDGEESCNEEAEEQEDLQIATRENLKQGDFVLVKFFGGKRQQTEFVFVCVVEDIDDMVQVMALKSTETKKEFVVDENDLSFINFDQILGILPSPEIAMRGERFRYIFKNPLSIKEH